MAKRENKKAILVLLLIFLLSSFSFVINSQAQGVNEDLFVTATVSGPALPPLPPPGPGPGAGGGGPAPSLAPANVVIEGRAYPEAIITILKNEQVAARFKAEKNGLFERELTGVNPAVYNFGIFADDTEGRKSVTVSFTVGVLSGRTTTISGIYLSPTISLEPAQVEKGEVVNISGQVFPESEVRIFVSSNNLVKETKAGSDGKWEYELGTEALEEAEHKARAKGFLEQGEQSPFSQTLSFLVVPRGGLLCRGADLNFDSKVNIVDFSILLYFWKQTRPSNRCADINLDGIVNIIDFSIMMYQWTR